MSRSQGRVFSRRTVLGGAAAGVAGAWLASAGPASAASSAPLPIDRVAARFDDRLIALRRDLHAHPEGPGQERRTAEVVARSLRAAGLDVTTGVGGHGVVAVLTGARPGRTVAYRADMDAVPPSDQIGGNATAAHLCGHDLHTTIGVGVALVLARLRERLSGRVMFVFQPAEESLSGARDMLADGVFDIRRPAEIHALHCFPFPVGEFRVTTGFGMPGQDRGVITLTGPDATARAELLAADLATLSTVTRPATPAALEQLVTDLQTPNGPLTRFVFLQARPAGAQVQVVYRCWPEPRYTEVRAEVRRRALAAGAESVEFPPEPFPAMISPVKEGRALERHLKRTIGRDRVSALHAAVPFSGEDYSLFLNEIPGTYTLLGVRSPRAAIESSYPHFGTFRPDERAIGHGVRAMAGWLASRT
ncbi:hydrolase [Actinoplanes italicus]|uniref:Amidohydrolase n=1 Tax=Actinoplanes italicus TaxID=113567 RepID=A0A2T0K609_9ACTN|nr:M20/M25/M40 family metallo-hydrolase [Actinoplanes italicus]PRX18395.1 amidohydrolase [Actinoplanes italicus]GIE32804.1 hydrolase [Actinoplanes italicus]